MKRLHLRTLVGAALLTAVAACSDSSGGNITKPGGALTYLHIAPTAPPLCADSVGGWAVKGGANFELALVFGTISHPCPDGRDFLRLKIETEGLQSLPNGTPIATGDSVFISVVWAGGDSVLFRLEPSGLVLSASNPAELHINYGETEESDDETVLQQAAIWRQEQPGDDFTRLSSTRHQDSSEIETRLNGFSRYAIAY